MGRLGANAGGALGEWVHVAIAVNLIVLTHHLISLFVLATGSQSDVVESGTPIWMQQCTLVFKLSLAMHMPNKLFLNLQKIAHNYAISVGLLI